MTNRFYVSTFVAVPGTVIASPPPIAEYASIQTAFDTAQLELNASLRGPNGETIARMPVAADRANKAFVFDAAGDPAVTVSATSAEMAAAVAAAVAASASAAAAAASAATVAGSTNAIHRLQLLSGVL